MKDLDGAWEWYRRTRESLLLFQRLGDRYWSELPWDGGLGNDDRFREIEGPVVVGMTRTSLDYLDDLAVLVLFSVFESVVRERVVAGIRDEEARIANRHLKEIVRKGLDDIEGGSFFRVMEIYKVRDADLVEEVNQVRRYRNWVAHGKRMANPPTVDPQAAFNRLGRFLAVLDELEAPTP